MDDLDFHSGKVASNFKSVTGTPAGQRRVLGALGLLGLAVVVLAVLVEHRFWWLTLTGRRTTARIAEREAYLVGYIVSRSGMKTPLTTRTSSSPMRTMPANRSAARSR